MQRMCMMLLSFIGLVLLVTGCPKPAHPPAPQASSPAALPQPPATTQPAEPLPAKSEVKYQHYANARYGFSVDYPNFAKRGTPPENGDGLDFTDANGFSMTASGGNNVLNDSLATQLAAERKAVGHANYVKKAADWFVVSGVNGDTIRYVRVHVGPGSINRLDISYPQSRKDYYAEVVKHISDSFKPGNLKDAH